MNPKEQLESIGISCNVHYEYVGTGKERHRVEDESKITDVRINLTDTEWCDLCMREREYYLGGCCGQMGYFQDRINKLFRNDGWIRVGDFAELVIGSETHEMFERFERSPGDIIEVALKDYSSLEPIDKIAATWNILKPAMFDRGRLPTGDVPPGYKDSNEWSQHLLQRGLQMFSFRDMFTCGDNDPNKEQRHLDNVVLDARILVHLRKVYEHWNAKDPAPIPCFAVLDENREVCNNRIGTCLYGTSQEAQTVLDTWKTDNSDEVDFSKYSIVPVTVSLEKGLVINLDE